MTNLLQIAEPGQRQTSFEKVVGIDLGTTHSVVAQVIHGKPQILGPLLPSILSLLDSGYVVGEPHGEYLSSTKRLMGKIPSDPICKHFNNLIPGDILRFQMGSYGITPVEVAGHILAHLKHLYSFDSAVITVPAHFDEAARVATKQAAALAGIKVLRLINEPTAAALAYGLEAGVEGIYAVYDFGGGTFDLSLLNLEKGVFQVLATGGDLTLGGDDIDRAIAESFGFTDTRKGRELKEALSDRDEFEHVKREAVEEIAAPFIKQTLKITEGVLRDAGMTPDEVKGVVLVGGMTVMPLVREEVAALFKKEPLCNIDPDHAVALGAALSAHSLTHGSDTLLVDVTPLSLGLETMGGLVEKIIHRNAPLPALASQEFTTHEDGQGGMIFHVVQGEREFAGDCRSLAQFELKGLPNLPAGVPRVRVDFAVDVEGLLTVSAIEQTTGHFQHIEVRPTYGLSDELLSQMILESQRHGREDMERRAAVTAAAVASNQ
jgi:molecular chaperone HscA